MGKGRQASKKFYNKCSENSRSEIVFRTDIFQKLTLGAPVLSFPFACVRQCSIDENLSVSKTIVNFAGNKPTFYQLKTFEQELNLQKAVC